MILKSLLKLLENKKIKYEIIKHKKVYTAIDAAGTQHIKPDEVVKTLVMKLDNEYALALISANKNLDKNKLAKTINVWRKKQGDKIVKKVEFAKEAWMKKNIRGAIGATPPFGELCGLMVLVDTALLRQKKFYANTGDYNYSVKIIGTDFKKTFKEAFIQGNFSLAKKIKKQKAIKKNKKISGKKTGKKKKK